MFEQRHLNFNKFLQQRAEEISKFRDILKLQTKKKGHQALPKCIRRRAMSHNRYRIPSKMRKLNQQELIKAQNMQRIPKCRKHIRKRRRLILSYKDRHSKIKWLSTHLWAAKRMRMINYYGYKVAQRPNQKAFRSSYRYFRNNCCMIDLSYYQCLTLNCNKDLNQFPHNILIQCKKENNTLKNYQLNQMQSNKWYNGYCFDSNNKLICPLIIFNCGSQVNYPSNQIIRCFFHPSALEQIKNQFPNGNIIQKSKSQIYCLIGPQWSTKIFQAMKIYGINTSQEDVEKLKLNDNSSQSFYSEKDTKTQNIPHLSNPIGSLFKQTYNSKQTSNQIRMKTLKIFEMLSNQNKGNNEFNLSAQNNEKNFWKFYSQLTPKSDEITFKITTRSKYTHKRKNKISKQDKKKVIILQTKKRQLIHSKNNISQDEPDSMSYEMIEQSLENIKNQIKQIFIEQSRPQNFINDKKQKQFKVNPIFVASFKKQQLLTGCYLFCSDQDSCRLWRILSKLNIKVIGLQEYNHILLQSMHLNFPQNYINTKSFDKYSHETSLKQFKRIQLRPPQRRINFLKINSPNPLSLIQSPLIQNSQTVFIEMVNKGRCFSHSYIYQLNKEDIQLIQKEISNKGTIGIILSQTTNNSNSAGFKKNEKYFDYKKQSMNSLIQKLNSSVPKRKLIGRIISGGYLYSKNKQGGIGYVSGQIGCTIQNLTNSGYVLIRKASSPHYYLGQITKLYPKIQRKF